MCWSGKHIKWLVDTGERLKTADGKEVEVWELRHDDDEEVLSAWAKHFRNHYCLDKHIDLLRGGMSRKEYLKKIKFPSETTTPGPSIRAGDFGEILVADYLQFVLECWVPRLRWSSKIVRHESPKGSDVIGFKFRNENGEASAYDTLFVFESKTKFSSSTINRLQDAINDSAKDPIRIDESLNYIKQRLVDQGATEEALKVERYQNPVDIPYKEIFGAAALISDEYYDEGELRAADCTRIPKTSTPEEYFPHPKRNSLVLIVIKGKSMMELVNELYRRAADEAEA